jgi:hypothetical protein
VSDTSDNRSSDNRSSDPWQLESPKSLWLNDPHNSAPIYSPDNYSNSWALENFWCDATNQSEGTPFTDIGFTDDMYTLLKILANTSSYYQSSLRFAEQSRFREFRFLSEKQQDWAYEIFADLMVKVNRQIAIDVWRNKPVGKFDWGVGSNVKFYSKE